jgi:hypothetical protein
LCVGGFQVGDGICVGSTSKVIPSNFLSIMNMVGVDASGFYGDQGIINSQVAIPMGASTLLCMDMEKNNIGTSSITKSYTYNMDTLFASICIICNVNKPKTMLQVWKNIHSS